MTIPQTHNNYGNNLYAICQIPNGQSINGNSTWFEITNEWISNADGTGAFMAVSGWVWSGDLYRPDDGMPMPTCSNNPPNL